MRFSKINRYLLLLAAFFALAVLRRSDFPGEEMLPGVYRATVYRTLLAPAAAAVHGDALARVELESELEAARLEIVQLKDQLERTHELQAYFEALEWEAQPVALPAWVFAIESDDYRRTFWIDRGSADGVKRGMPVVSGKALLGVVLEVRRGQAIVRRVDDPSFRLEVEIQTAGGMVRGIARGDGDRGLDIRYVPKTQSLRAGDAVFTTSYHLRVPSGLVVGWVAEVDDLDQDGIHEVKAAPAAALGRWAFAHVLKKRER